MLAEFHLRVMHIRGPGPARETIRQNPADPTHEWLGVTADVVHQC